MVRAERGANIENFTRRRFMRLNSAGDPKEASLMTPQTTPDVDELDAQISSLLKTPFNRREVLSEATQKAWDRFKNATPGFALVLASGVIRENVDRKLGDYSLQMGFGSAVSALGWETDIPNSLAIGGAFGVASSKGYNIMQKTSEVSGKFSKKLIKHIETVLFERKKSSSETKLPPPTRATIDG